MFPTILIYVIAAITTASSTRHDGTLDDRKDPRQTENSQKDDDVRCQHFNEPDVLSMSFVMPNVTIPTQQTTYMCLEVDLPSDQEYHFIGAEFELDNYDFVHHMGLQSCDHPVKRLSEPKLCKSDTMSDCKYALAIYNQGVKQTCLPPAAGVLFGRSTRVASLSIHYTNPDGLEGLHDSSGFKIYYTAKRRRFNAGLFTVGQMGLEIPASQENILQSATCSTSCTRQILKGPVQVTWALNHMHFLGTSQNATLFRANQPPFVIINVNNYSYGSPTIKTYDPPLTILPGDRIEVNCHYNSTSRNTTTVFGRSSFDEMCFVYMTYYPAENVLSQKDAFWPRSCLQNKDKDLCWHE